MFYALILVLIVFSGGAGFYFARRSLDFRKFLTGAFFVSSGVQYYLYLVKLSIPILGTNLGQTPPVSATRSIVHFGLFLLCFYCSFFRSSPPAADVH